MVPLMIREISQVDARTLLGLLGSFFAGFNAFGHLTTFVTLGALGTWVREYWLPLTRYFWELVTHQLAFLYISLTVEEKDALTAIAFFSPLAIYLLATPRERVDLDNNTMRILRAFSILSGVFLVAIIASQPLYDLFSFGKSALFTYIGSTFIYLLAVVLLIFYNDINLNNKDKLLENNEIINDRAFSYLHSKYAISLYAIPACILCSYYIGVIRTAAPFAIIAIIIYTVRNNPWKLVYVSFWIISLLISSFAYDFILFFKNKVELG